MPLRWRWRLSATCWKRSARQYSLPIPEADGQVGTQVFENPKVAAIVDFEPGYAFPTGEAPPGQLQVPLADYQKLTQIPIVVVVGDFLDKVPGGLPRLTNAQAIVQTLNNHGGNAKLIYLPRWVSSAIATS